MTTAIQPQDKSVTVNGLKLHYLDWGTTGKTPMLLLHGLRGHAHSWDDFSLAMCQTYHVLAIDQRGRGDSDWAPNGDYSTAAYVSDLAAFSDALGLTSFVLAGHSMGGRNSMAFTATYPHQVQKLIIVDVGPTIDPRGAARIKQEIKHVPEAFDSFEAVMAYMSKQNTYASDMVLRRRLQSATKALTDGSVGWCYDVAIRDQSRQGTGAPPVDLWSEIPKITCPTLIVRGQETDLLSPDVAQKMVDAMPHATRVDIARAGHMVFEDNPDDFNRVVREWLS